MKALKMRNKPLHSIMSDFSVGLAREMEHFKRVDEAKNADPFRESEVVALSIVYGISTIQTRVVQ